MNQGRNSGKTNKMPVPTESVEQQTLFRWAKLFEPVHPELKLMYHVPNEGKRSYAAGRRLVAEGLKSGVPDICLPVARGGYHGLYIELKRLRGGKLTEDQRDWLDALNDEGYMTTMCKGWQAASEVILRYLEMKEN